jgi:hypothetical protein
VAEGNLGVYLNPQELLHYSVNQYRCADMKALKEKLRQFPEGSSFDFAWDFSARDEKELIEISGFLRANGYKVRNPQNWNFLLSDSHLYRITTIGFIGSVIS